MEVTFIKYPIQEWLVDWENETLGDSVMGLEAIAQDIRFALSTERNKYPIMGPNFGVTLNDLIGMDSAYVQANVKKRISDALSIDDRILSVSEFKFTKPDMDSMLVSFLVTTVLGDLQMTTELIGS